jgi:hypothetical protein
MPTDSKYERFYVPRDGEEETPDGVDGPLQSVDTTESWGDTFQTNIDILEGEIPMLDTLANRPAADSGLNLFYATDEQQWYWSDGVSWFDNPTSGSTNLSSLSISGWNLVDVSNEGYDGTGSKDLADVYETYGSNTIYILPEGTYRISTGIEDTNAFDYVGFVGAPRATLDVVDNSNGQVFLFGGTNVASDRVLLKNLDVDITGTAPSGLDIDRALAYGTIHKSAHVEDVELIGSRHRYQDYDGDGTLETNGRIATFLIRPNETDAYVYHKGLRMPDGGTWESGAGGTSGHAVGSLSGGAASKGTTIYENCYYANFINQAWYVKNDAGRWLFRGCVAENCGNANFRIGNGDSIVSCTSIQDNASNQAYPSGVCLSIQDAKTASVDTLEMIATDTGQDPIRISPSTRSVTIQNSYLDLGSGPTCDLTGSTAGEGVLFQNCVIDDSGTPGQFAPVRISRPDVTFRECQIRSTDRYCINVNDGTNRLTLDGCHLETGDDHLLIGEDSSLTFDEITLMDTTFSGAGTGSGGFYLYSGDTINRINVIDCDLTAVTSPKEDVYGTVNEWRSVSNRGFGGDELGPLTIPELNAVQWADPADDQTGIEDAIAALPASGGTVVLQTGTYTLSSAVSVPSNTTIVGQGYASEVYQSTAGERAFLANTSDNVHFRDFRVSGTGTTNTAGYGAITIADVSNTGDGNLDCSVTRVAIENVSSCGVTIGTNAENASVSDCWIDSPIEHGIYVSNSAARCFVHGNRLTNSGQVGIKHSGGSGLGWIAGNYVAGSGTIGILSDRDGRSEIVGNHVKNPGSDGIKFNGNRSVCQGNALDGAADQGILVFGNGTVYSHLSICNNLIHQSAKSGILLDTVHNSLICGNVITGSGYTSTDSYHNIQVKDNSDQNNIQMNTCRTKADGSTPKYGIVIQTSDCDANLVTNNDLLNSGATASLQDNGTGTVTTAGNRL